MSELTSAHRARLMADLRTGIADAEEVLRITADQASAGVAELRVRMQERLHQARGRLHELQETAVARARAASHATDDYVHEHPWKAAGTAMAVGMVIGLLISRR
jgi:ElaB/YqjD/DUF883 family membrane-anchored ribosome-binding protein